MSYTSKYTGEEIDNGITPVGTVIAFMGTKAPKGYLICDGTEYNITDYPKLANHFAEQFENIAYFGGDGETTFAVPDLRNEFLRGYGNRTNEIGMHQDATAVPNTGFNINTQDMWINSVKYAPNSDSSRTYNYDEVIKTDNTSSYSTSKWTVQWQGDGETALTVRPTNVAVLY